MIKLTQELLDHSKTEFIILSKTTPMVKIKFYHLRDSDNKPYATICRFKLRDGRVISLGISFCAKNDNFSKKIGRDISFSRALKALESKQNHFPINYDSKSNKSALLKFSENVLLITHKAVYNDLTLTDEDWGGCGF